MRSTTPRYVYIIRSGDFAKVGSSRDPEKRMAQLNTALPVAPHIAAVFVSTPGLEFKLHHYLIDRHARHEWFHWCPKLADIVANGIPSAVHLIPPGSPFFSNRGGRKPRMVEAAQ